MVRWRASRFSGPHSTAAPGTVTYSHVDGVRCCYARSAGCSLFTRASNSARMHANYTVATRGHPRDFFFFVLPEEVIELVGA